MATTHHTSHPHRSSHWEGAFNAYQTAFEQIKKSPAPALVFAAIIAVASLMDRPAAGSADKMPWDQSSSFQNFIILVCMLFITQYALDIAKKRDVTVNDFFRFDIGKYFRLLGCVLLLVIIIALSAIPLLIPLIWTIPWFVLAPYVLVDKDIGPIEALKESKKLSEDHKGKVWAVIGVSILLSIVAGLLMAIPLVGGAALGLVTLITGAASAILYYWLRGHAK